MKILAMSTAITTALAATLVATPAMAETKSIEWRDLNLNTVEGQRALDRRIDAAAKDVCGASDVNTGSRITRREVRQCMDNARASTKKQIAAIREETRLGG